MSKFKVGQKVYCILYGVGAVKELRESRSYPVIIETNCGLVDYTAEGKYNSNAVNPTLLTLEEARAKGYDVPKQKIVKEKTVYINLYENHSISYNEKSIAIFNIVPWSPSSGHLLAKAHPVTIKYEIEE